jgi:hypothetical protein
MIGKKLNNIEMKKIILCLILAVSFCNCGENKKKVNMQNPNINANNIVDELSKQVKNFSSEPIYLFSYDKYYCHFEVYVNDILAFKNFKNNMSSSAFEINKYLFKNGKNKIVYKMYPIGIVEGSKENHNTLMDKTYLKLNLESYDLKNADAEDIKYSTYTTPSVTIKTGGGYSVEKFEGAGKEYYEGSFEIDVKIPYAIHPVFEKAKDLRRMDQIVLNDKVFKMYSNLHKYYDDNNLDNIAKTSFDGFRDEFVSSYKSKSEINDTWNELISIYKNSSFKMQPIKDYKLEFSADGKLVSLISNNLDYKFRHSHALWAKVNLDGGIRPFFIDTYLYIPEGETEFKVY